MSFLDTLKIDSILVEGSTDDIGGKNYNQKLALKRAEFIARKIGWNKSMKDSLMRIEGLGEVPLMGTTVDIEDQRRLNRNVKVSYFYSIERKKELNLKELAVGDTLRIDKIQFEGGRSVFLISSLPILKELTAELKNNIDLNIEIQGHVCCTQNGAEGFNIDKQQYSLSEDRAKAVYRYLVNQGIDAQRLSYIGLKGRLQTAYREPRDRRVEIVIK